MSFVKVSYKYKTLETEGSGENATTKEVVSTCSGVLMLKSEWEKKKTDLQKMDGFECEVVDFVKKKREVIEDA